MNADSPFALARLLRNYADAIRRDDPVATEVKAAGPLPFIEAAAWFQRINSGVPNCDYSPAEHRPPCTAAARFAVSAPPQTYTVRMACAQHLNDLIQHGMRHIDILHDADSSPFGPTRRRGASVANLEPDSDRPSIAARLQRARRQLRRHPAREQELQPLVAALHRRERRHTGHATSANPADIELRRRPTCPPSNGPSS